MTSLDGLRGIAILAVMLHNARYLRGGFLGVDIFFVLSGFLITVLLLQERQRSGTIRLGAFYARRALRLLPALFTLLAVVLLAPGLFYLRAPPWKDAAIAAFYGTNWVNAFGLRNMAIFDHTWSLTVEEQFYVLWPPLMLVLLAARVRRARILSMVLAGIGASTGLRVLLWDGPASIERLYYGLDTRFDALLVGCLVALLVSWDLIPRTGKAVVAIRVIAGASAVVLGFLLLTASRESRLTYHGVSTLACAAVAGLLLHVVYCPSRLRTLVLDNAPLVWVGGISYSLYLWHDPLFLDLLNSTRMAKLGLSGPAVLVVRFIAAFAAASLSFYLIERPFLRIKRRFGGAGAPVTPPATEVVPPDLVSRAALDLSRRQEEEHGGGGVQSGRVERQESAGGSDESDRRRGHRAPVPRDP
ncbi:MAG: acyltransferase family protein [Candidatus Rokuibacteriota bacterium]